jgi:molecular chaperone DnaJ
VKLKVAPGTPSGRTLRVKGKGVQLGSKQGDLLATLEVVVPAHLSGKAKELLEKFEGELPEEDPRADLLSKAGLL